MLLLFSFCGVAAGYTSARLYTSVFRGTSGRGQTLRTALTFPGVAFIVFIVLNTLIWGQHSSGAVPFGTLFVLCFLWFGISVPLVFVGAYFGARAEPLADPVRTNKIPRQIPEQPLYMSAPVTILLGGVLQWADCLGEKSAWDTLTWFAVLVGMSGQLNALGLVAHVSTSIGGALTALHLTWPAVCVLMNVAYFVLHYIFASQTAHVGALLSACLAVMLTAGVPPVLGTLTLAYTTNLFGAITHYSSGQAAVYYGAGYTDLPTTFRMVRALCPSCVPSVPCV